MVHTASHARQETGKRGRNYKVAQRQAQYGELQECTQRSQQCSAAAIQWIKPYDTKPPVPRATQHC